MKASELNNAIGNTKPPISVMTLVDQMKITNNDGPNFSIFLGAGASFTSGISTGQCLVNEWRTKAYTQGQGKEGNRSETDTPDMMRNWLTKNEASWYDEKNEYPSLFGLHYRMPKLRRKFVEEMVEGKSPSIGYTFLVRLIESQHLGAAFTTNFDDLINEAFHVFSSQRPVVCAHDSSVSSISVSSSRPKIIKLHGDYLFDNIKVSSGEVSTLEQNMEGKFTQYLREFGLIICGYSGRDKSILNILESSISQENMLEHGLYWVFRPDDEVNDRVLELLKNPKACYVIADGFDEFLAEIYAATCDRFKPIVNNDLAIGSQDVLSRQYLENSIFDSSNPYIKEQLDAIQEQRTGSELSQIIQAINTEFSSNSRHTHEDMIRLLKIQQMLFARDFQGAIERIKSELNTDLDNDTRKGLLSRLIGCIRNNGNNREAIDATDRLIQIEPENHQSIILKASLLYDCQSKIDILKDFCSKYDSHHHVLNFLAKEMINSHNYSSPSDPNKDDILITLDKSIKRNPAISNSAWKIKFDFLLDSQQNAENLVSEIIEEHIQQSPYGFRTMNLLFQLAKRTETTLFNSIDLFARMDEGLKKHFPKDKARYFTIMTNACLEFNQTHIISEIYRNVKEDKEITQDDIYVKQLMTLQYNFYCDLDGAIGIGQEHLNKDKSIEIEEHLLDFLIDDNRITDAENILTGLQGTITPNEWHEYKSQILAKNNMFQDAIDELMKVPDKTGFTEQHASTIAYYYLKMNDFKKSKETSAELLHKYLYKSDLPIAHINYEFAKKKLGGKVNTDRLKKVASATKSKVQKGTIYILLGQTKEGLNLLDEEASKYFSNISNYLKWPVLEDYQEHFKELGKRLKEMGRSSPVPIKTIDISEKTERQDLPTVYSHSQDDLDKICVT